MKKIFLACALVLGFAFTAVAGPSDAAAYPVYRKLEGRWVVPKGDTPKYASLDKARKGQAEGETATIWDACVQRGQDGQWLHLADAEGGEFWASAPAFMELDDFLKNPPKDAEVACGADLPKSFQADLDAANKGAWILIRDHPTLSGGGAIVEVWDSAKKTLLWHSAPLDKLGRDNPLYCGQAGTQWVQIVGDMDNDGKAELAIKHAQSEIGPGVFTFWRWDGKAFVPLYESRRFLSVAQKNPGVLPMGKGQVDDENIFDGKIRIWVDDLLQAPGNGVVTANLTILRKDAQQNGKAQLRVDKNGNLVFEKWLSGPSSE